MNAFNVFLKGKWIDTVFFIKGIDVDHVRDSLINHDEYNPAIRVVKR